MFQHASHVGPTVVDAKEHQPKELRRATDVQGGPQDNGSHGCPPAAVKFLCTQELVIEVLLSRQSVDASQSTE